MMARLGALCVLLIAGITAMAEAAVPAMSTAFVVGDEPFIKLGGGKLKFWGSESAGSSFEDAQRALEAGLFERVPGNLDLAYEQGRAWVFFELYVPGQDPRPRGLEVRPSYLDLVQVYQKSEIGPWAFRGVLGDTRPFGERPHVYRHGVFRLLLQPGYNRFLVSVESRGALHALFRLWTPWDLRRHAFEDYLLLGLRYGVVLALLIANVIFAFIFRRWIFATFSTFLFLNILNWMAVDGLLGALLFPHSPQLVDSAQPVLGLLVVGANWWLFSKFLEARSRYPRFHYLALGGIALSLGAVLATLGGAYREVAPLVQLYTLAALPALVAETWTRWQPGTRVWGEALSLTLFLLATFCHFYQVLVVSSYSEVTAALAQISQFSVMWLVNANSSRRGRAYQLATLEKRREVEAAEAIGRETMLAVGERESMIRALVGAARHPLAQVDDARAQLKALAEEDGGLGPEEASRLQTLEQSVERLRLLLSSNAPSADPVFRPRLSRQDLTDLFEEVLELLPRSEAARIRVQKACEEIFVEGDRRLLSLALLNIFENALRYSPKDSIVNVAVKRTYNSGRAGHELRVENEGAALSGREQEQAFKKYERLGGGGGKAGLGLGLFLVRQIVIAHGGRVEFEPNRPSGVELTMWLPEGNA
ncbi:MAG: hypothetical protein ISQ02_02930 [Pseudomonadales bacterium]|nr:hypothetical protein [Pseudomonadales bacterium]